VRRPERKGARHFFLASLLARADEVIDQSLLFPVMARTCQKRLGALGPLCRGDSDMERFSDDKIAVDIDTIRCRRHVRFFAVGHSQARLQLMLRDGADADVDQVASA
jgi:hypothetical protein